MHVTDLLDTSTFADALAVSLRYAIAFTFLLAALPKLVDSQSFELAVDNYDLLPPRLGHLAARLLPWLEVACSIALLLGAAVSAVSAALAALLVLFASAVATNLLRGRKIECGCEGSIAPRTLSWQLVASDLALAAAAVFVSVRDPRTLTAFAPGGSLRPTALTNSNALALVVVAGSVVLMRLLVAAWLRLRSSSPALAVHIREEV